MKLRLFILLIAGCFLSLEATSYFLTWDKQWDNNIVYNVYAGTNYENFPEGWKIIGVTSNNVFPIDITSCAMFYSVKASNVVTHLESDFSTR